MACSRLMYPMPISAPSSDLNIFETVQSIGNISLICPMCHCIFRNPKVLKCFHTLCLHCLLNLRSKYRTIICVICQKDQVDPRGLEELLPDFIIQNCLHALHDLTITKCNHCKNVLPLVSVCLKCRNYLCSTCEKIKYCVEIQELGDFPTNLFPYNRQNLHVQQLVARTHGCYLHPDTSLIYYCNTCETPTCRVCMDDCQYHLAHNYTSLNEVKEIQNKALVKLVQDKLCECKPLEYFIEIQFASFNELKYKYQQVKNQITNIFQRLRVNRALQHNCFCTLDHIYLITLKYLIKLLQDLKNSFGKICNISIFVEGLKNFTSCSQRLVFKKVIQDELNDLNPTYLVNRITLCKNNFTLISGLILQHLDNSSDFQITLNIHELLDFNQILIQIQMEEPCTLSLGYFGYEISLSPNFHRDMEVIGPKIYDTIAIPIVQIENFCRDRQSFERKILNCIPPKILIQRTLLRYTKRFGQFGKGNGEFAEMGGIATTSYNEIIVLDSNNHRIQVFDLCGNYMHCFGDRHRTSFPTTVAVNRLTGNIFIGERSPSHQIKVYNNLGNFLYKFGNDCLVHPRAIALDHQNKLIVVECKIKIVTIFTETGQYCHRFSCNQVEFPISADVNKSQEIFIADNKEHCIKVFSYGGKFMRRIGCSGLTDYPAVVKFCPAGYLFVADNHEYLKFTIFKEDGQLVAGLTTKVKQNPCVDFTFMSENTVALTCHDFKIYFFPIHINLKENLIYPINYK